MYASATTFPSGVPGIESNYLPTIWPCKKVLPLTFSLWESQNLGRPCMYSISIDRSLKQRPRCPSSHPHLQALFGVSAGVSRPDGICNPTSMFWACPEVSYQLDVPSISPQLGVFTGIPMSCPTTLTGFLNAKEQQLFSELHSNTQSSCSEGNAKHLAK